MFLVSLCVFGSRVRDADGGVQVLQGVARAPARRRPQLRALCDLHAKMMMPSHASGGQLFGKFSNFSCPRDRQVETHDAQGCSATYFLWFVYRAGLCMDRARAESTVPRLYGTCIACLQNFDPQRPKVHMRPLRARHPRSSPSHGCLPSRRPMRHGD